MSKTLGIATVFCAAFAAAYATDPPDSVVNPQSGFITTVASIPAGEDTDVWYTLDPGEGRPTSSICLTTESENDRAPRIVAAASGDVWVAWWRDTTIPEVRIRKHDDVEDAWGSERLVSEALEPSRDPDLAFDGTTLWVAFELGDEVTSRVAVVAVEDEPTPIGARTIVAATSGSGLDVQIRSASGHLWLTWIDTATEVGWSEYDGTTETWSQAGYDSYEEDSVGAARARVEALVTGE